MLTGGSAHEEGDWLAVDLREVPELHHVDPTLAPRILVVDDDGALRRALARELCQDFEVVEASGVTEAIALIDAADAIVADLDLGAGSGLDVLGAARAGRPTCVRILMSAGPDPNSVADALRAGVAHTFLTKPWRPGLVAEVVRSLLPSLAGRG